MKSDGIFDSLDQARWIIFDRLKESGTADMLVDQARFSLSRLNSPADDEQPADYEARCRLRLSNGLPVDLTAFFNDSDARHDLLVGVLSEGVVEAAAHLTTNARRIDDRLDLIRVAAETIVLDQHMKGAIIAIASILPRAIDVTSRPRDYEPTFDVVFGIVDEQDELALFDVEAKDAGQLARRFTTEVVPVMKSRLPHLR